MVSHQWAVLISYYEQRHKSGLGLCNRVYVISSCNYCRDVVALSICLWQGNYPLQVVRVGAIKCVHVKSLGDRPATVALSLGF